MQLDLGPEEGNRPGLSCTCSSFDGEVQRHFVRRRGGVRDEAVECHYASVVQLRDPLHNISQHPALLIREGAGNIAFAARESYGPTQKRITIVIGQVLRKRGARDRRRFAARHGTIPTSRCRSEQYSRDRAVIALCATRLDAVGPGDDVGTRCATNRDHLARVAGRSERDGRAVHCSCDRNADSKVEALGIADVQNAGDDRAGLRQ